MPAALAIGEEMGTSGRQFMESLLLGYEVSSRLGSASRPRPNVHSHGHWGTPGAAAAVAKLKGYTANQVRDVVNLSTSMSPGNSWTPCFEGATIRNAYSGRSGFQGVLAVHMYEAGFTGIHDAPADVFGTILGDEFHADDAVQGLGGIHRIQQNYFKFHACCSLQPPYPGRHIGHNGQGAVRRGRGGGSGRGDHRGHTAGNGGPLPAQHAERQVQHTLRSGLGYRAAWSRHHGLLPGRRVGSRHSGPVGQGERDVEP